MEVGDIGIAGILLPNDALPIQAGVLEIEKERK
jgi:hypothetical protein